MKRLVPVILLIFVLLTGCTTEEARKPNSGKYVNGDKTLTLKKKTHIMDNYTDPADKAFGEYNEVPIWVHKDTNYPEIFSECRRYRDAKPNALHLITVCKHDGEFFVMESEGVDVQELYEVLRIYYASGDLKAPVGYHKKGE